MPIKKITSPLRWFLLLHYDSFETTSNKLKIPQILWNVGLPPCGRVILPDLTQESELYCRLKDTVMEAFHDNGWDMDAKRPYYLYILEYPDSDSLIEFEDMLSGLNTLQSQTDKILSMEDYYYLTNVLDQMHCVSFTYTKAEVTRLPKGSLVKVIGVDVGDKVEEYQQSVGKVGRVIEWDEGTHGTINVIELLDDVDTTLHLVEGEWEIYPGSAESYFNERANRIPDNDAYFIRNSAGLMNCDLDNWGDPRIDKMDPDLKIAFYKYREATLHLAKTLMAGNTNMKRDLTEFGWGPDGR